LALGLGPLDFLLLPLLILNTSITNTTQSQGQNPKAEGQSTKPQL
jgi:hypothetical protein